MRMTDSQADLAVFNVQVAAEAIEDYTGRSGVTKSYRWQAMGWPQSAIRWPLRWQLPNGWPVRSTSLLHTFELRRTPLAGVTSVKYYPADGTAQVTVDATNYYVDTESEPGNVMFREDYEFAELASRPDAVQVDFTAGYGLAEDDIPFRFRQAALILARHYVDHPELVGIGNLNNMPYSFRSLLFSLRVSSYTPQ